MYLLKEKLKLEIIGAKHINMKGKCNCGKKATSEYMVRHHKYGYTLLFCDSCKPKYDTPAIYRIDH